GLRSGRGVRHRAALMSSTMDVADAVVIGSGPNGLTAGITLARKGWDVVVLERNATPGGAVASAELTKPGYVHDPFSAFYGLLHSSPVFRELKLDKRVAWAHFETPVGAAVDPNNGAFIHRDLRRTADGLGDDGEAWLELYTWWQRIGTRFFDTMLAPIPPIRRGLRFLRAAKIGGSIDTARTMLTKVVVERGRARAVETARGRIVRARHAILADTGPRALFHDLVGDEHLPARFLDGLRTFRYGTGMFKVDLALDARAPWLVEQARD